jgi:hypothetical protein
MLEDDVLEVSNSPVLNTLTIVKQEGKKVTICVDARKLNQCTVMRIPIDRQLVGKHIPTEAKARNNRRSIARKRISKHAFLAIEAVSSAWYVKVIIKKCSAA